MTAAEEPMSTAPVPSGPLGETLLEIRGLSVDYGLDVNPVHAVADVDLVIRRGEIVGLAGESGSGKSTLAYAVARLLRDPGVITAGDVTFYDWPKGSYRDQGYDTPTDLTEPSAADANTGPRRVDVISDVKGSPVRVDLLTSDKQDVRAVRWSEIAVVFQSALNALNPVLRIGKLLDDVLKTSSENLSKAERRVRSEELLGIVGISADRLSSYPHQLSGGMRQRVMIAVAIALRPSLLIMDEPTTALDVVIQREILEELMDLRERLGFSVLFITHDLSLLIEIADTIAVMYAGKLIEKGPAKAVFRAPRHPYTYGLTRSFPSLHGEKKVMTGIEGSPPDLRRVPSGCPFHPRCAWAMDICTTQVPPVIELHDAAGGREVLCWLHDGDHVVPEQLALTPPAAGTLASRPSMRALGTPAELAGSVDTIEGGSAL